MTKNKNFNKCLFKFDESLFWIVRKKVYWTKFFFFFTYDLIDIDFA